MCLSLEVVCQQNFGPKKFQMRMLFLLIIREGMRKLHDQEFTKEAKNTTIRFAPLRRMKFFGLHYISYRIGTYLEKKCTNKAIQFDID